MSLRVPNPGAWDLGALCVFGDNGPDTSTNVQNLVALRNLLYQCGDAAFDVSEVISATYFTHSGESKKSVGA